MEWWIEKTQTRLNDFQTRLNYFQTHLNAFEFFSYPPFHQEGHILTLSLLRVIKVKFPLQPHQKYYITQ